MLPKKCCHHYETCKLIAQAVENTLIILAHKSNIDKWSGQKKLENVPIKWLINEKNIE